MKKVLSLLLVMALCLSLCACKKNAAEDAKVAEEVAGLKEEIASLKEDIAGKNEQITGLKEQAAGLNGQIAELEKDVEALQNPPKNCPAELVGEWKSTNISWNVPGASILGKLSIEVLVLNADGTGSYKTDANSETSYDCTWTKSEKWNRIDIDTSYGEASLSIEEKDGKILLKGAGAKPFEKVK